MASKIRHKIYILGLVIACIFWGGVFHSHSKQETVIRIALFKGVPNINISIRGKYRVVDRHNNLLLDGKRLRRTFIRSDNGGITIGEDHFPFNHIRFVIKKDSTLYVKNKAVKYRGDIGINIKEDDKLLVVNTIELEKYVRGVLYREITDRWPLEAIKAQAIAVRTYALYQMGVNKYADYDVTGNIYSQVYGGRSAERYRTNVGAKRTKGKILIYNAKVLPAYFHSNSGGHTEDVSEVWENDLFPLKGKPDQYAQLAPNYEWKKNFRLKNIQEKLNRHGYHLGLIKGIEILSRNKSGRIKDLQIITRDGKKLMISGKKFRDIIGPNEVKSNMYDIVMQGYYVDLIGKGWGHGVGMCQWGAYQMALKRFKYKEILEFYYPGSEIVDISQI